MADQDCTRLPVTRNDVPGPEFLNLFHKVTKILASLSNWESFGHHIFLASRWIYDCISYSILYNHKVNVNRFNSLSLSLTRSEPVCAVHASGCGWSAEDVVQLALQAQPIRPAPQVIEIEMRGLPVDDAPGIDEIMIPAGFELQQDQVFGGRHPDRQSF